MQSQQQRHEGLQQQRPSLNTERAATLHLQHSIAKFLDVTEFSPEFVPHPNQTAFCL
jgi:hypothetical protein